jgi:valyl-tRNA synthetase
MNQFQPESLPNRFDHAEAQPRIYGAWEQRRQFHAEPDSNPLKFSIVIPPPNVTGALHLGHALNNTLQDVQIRMKRMQGFNTLWMPGTDHAGIATQAVVERRLREEENLTRHDLGRDKLIARIWQWKEQYEARILTQLKQMGCSCDWDRTRFTFDEGCSKAVRYTFFNLFRQGLLYRGKRLVNWDTFLQTAVSDDEVFPETVQGKFWHFKYPVINPQLGEPTHVEVATTRPETMLGDTAVAVHPDPAQALNAVEAELQERLAKAPAKEKEALQQQIENIQQRRNEVLPLLIQLRDMALAGRKLMLPLQNREIPLIVDEWAKPELGTGAVKITPAHDPNDYAVWQRNLSIGAINILNPDGTLNENAGAYQGMKMGKAREQVVAAIDALGLLGDVEDREIELPHSDRSKTPIEPYLADQWFVKMGDVAERPGLAQKAMDAVSDARVKIFPERYAKSYLDWLGEKRDWPVSRQLWWGHRIPVWSYTLSAEGSKALTRGHQGMPSADAAAIKLYQEMPERFPEAVSRPEESPLEEAMKQKFAAQSQAKATVIINVEPQAMQTTLRLCVRDDAPAAELEAAGYVQDPDVLDTWFSSALWPHSTLGWPAQTPELAYYYPTSTLITSRDIITLWVARMVLTGLNNMGEIPFREVFIHPKILDGYGETMSKSKGNGVDPLDIVDKFGADALRFGLASLCTETQDVRMPVQFECPNAACQSLIDQTKKNRELPRIKCDKCGQEFSTQWAKNEADKSLPRGAVVSERFEVARNFTSKLWNAARFALINLQGYTPGAVSPADLTTEDRWILSRLNTVTREVTESLAVYHYADAAKSLYDFAWDEFCSFYIEMAKSRLQDARTRPQAQRVLAHVLDVLLRLLHPMMPFVTEEMWQNLNRLAPVRGLPQPEAASEFLIVAKWPNIDVSLIESEIEARFSKFQWALEALRRLRANKNISMRTTVSFVIKGDESTKYLLEEMLPYFSTMANAVSLGIGPDIERPKMSVWTWMAGMEIAIDQTGLIDVPAEIAKNEKLEQQLLGFIKGKEAKLGNESFVAKAPPAVVQTEREALAQAQAQLASVRETLATLRT